MPKSHLEFLVEEPSTEAFLQALLPQFLKISFSVSVFQGKKDLLNNLPARLLGYRHWLPQDWGIVVLVDRDNQDCQRLKQDLENTVQRSGLHTRTQAGASAWQVVSRIAIEELEAWFWGDWEAVRQAFPNVDKDVVSKPKYRDPDAIAGGTWETLERTLQNHGYYKGGLQKIDLARRIGPHFKPEDNRSQSFKVFWQAVLEAVQ